VLEIDQLSVSIASMQILRDVSLQVPAGSMTGLIGRNGAGKTTVMKTVMGLLKAGSGSVRFESRDLLAVPTHARARLGIGYMPEDRRLIPELTVEENVLVPAWAAGLPDARSRLQKIYELVPEVKAFASRKGLPFSSLRIFKSGAACAVPVLPAISTSGLLMYAPVPARLLTTRTIPSFAARRASAGR